MPEKKDRNATVRSMRAEGKTVREIAVEFGVSTQRVHQILCRGHLTASGGPDRPRISERALNS